MILSDIRAVFDSGISSAPWCCLLRSGVPENLLVHKPGRAKAYYQISPNLIGSSWVWQDFSIFQFLFTLTIIYRRYLTDQPHSRAQSFDLEHVDFNVSMRNSTQGIQYFCGLPGTRVVSIDCVPNHIQWGTYFLKTACTHHQVLVVTKCKQFRILGTAWYEAWRMTSRIKKLICFFAIQENLRNKAGTSSGWSGYDCA